MARIRSVLFSSPGREGAAVARALLRMARLVWLAIHEFRLSHCFERAATLAFATLISLIPLSVLLLGVAVQFGVGDRFIQYAEEKIFPQLAPAFQQQLGEWLSHNISRNAFANSMVGAVGLGALASLVMTALGVLSTAERNFNRIWKAERSRSFLQRLATFWIVLTASPFIMTASLWIEDILVPKDGWIDRLTHESMVLRAVYGFVVPITIGFAGFTVLYRYLPATRVRLQSAMFGGFVAAILWELSKKGFWFYMGRASVVTSLYGSLAILPLFLIWLYLNCLILLWGCSLSYCHQNLSQLTSSMRAPGEIHGLPERFLALYFLEAVGKSFTQADASVTTLGIADELRVDVARLEGVARRLCEQDVLVPDPRCPGAFLLTRTPAQVKLQPLVAMFQGDELPAWAARPRREWRSSPERQGAVRVFERAQGAFAEALRDKTLADLLTAEGSDPAGASGDRR